MTSMNTSILLMKAFLISAGLLSLAIWIKFSFPIAMNEVPAMWSFVASWMKPPYVYIIINCIIITIVASSRFQKFQTETRPNVRSEHLILLKSDQPSDYASLTSHPEISTAVVEYMPTVEAAAELKHVMVTSSSKLYNETEEETMAKYEDEDADEDEAEDVFVDSIFTYNTLPQERTSSELHQLEYPLPVREKKPLISSRFGHRKPIRTSPEGVRSLRVPRPKKPETLDSIWKMITEERHVPLRKHLKKPDTWEHQGRHLTPVGDHVPKSETFKDRLSNDDSPPSSSLRKEPSPSQDGLNRRAEAFIKKCKYDMKLQRQESLNQHMEN